MRSLSLNSVLELLDRGLRTESEKIRYILEYFDMYCIVIAAKKRQKPPIMDQMKN